MLLNITEPRVSLSVSSCFIIQVTVFGYFNTVVTGLTLQYVMRFTLRRRTIVERHIRKVIPRTPKRAHIEVAHLFARLSPSA